MDILIIGAVTAGEYAARDVTGTSLFTFVAGEQGKTAVVNSVGGKHIELNDEILPRATFCDPEVASVGLIERQAPERGYKVKAGKFDYANLTRAIVSNETDGFIKIVVKEGSGHILGGHIVGAEASSLIHEIAAAMAGGLTVSDIGNTLHAYPTLSEGMVLLPGQLLGRCLLGGHQQVESYVK